MPEPESTPSGTVTGIGGTLTDGTGASKTDLTKLLKDFIADFLLGAAAALSTSAVLNLGDAIAAPQVAALAVAGAAIHAAYRIVLRWATTP